MSLPGPQALRWTAAVLAGGASRRMGRDKALLVVDGRPMVRRVVDAVIDAGAARVIVVGGDLTALAPAVEGTTTLVPDRHPGEGPLGGLLTAFAHLAGADDPAAAPVPDVGIVMALACDLVAPMPRAVEATVAALAGDDEADVAAPEVDGAVQWLHAAWRTSTVAAPLAERFAAGERSVHRAVAQAGLRLVEVPGLNPVGLADADTPSDLDRHRGQHPEWH
jgi:molybdopterin-guanine dinucleotide biosynthesis protein A